MISHPTASAVILDDGHVLLLESAKGTGFIYPGGHVDNETPAAAAIREVREETGLEIELTYEPRYSHPRISEVPLPFVIIDVEVTDRKIGPHRHVDAVYLARPLTAKVTVNHESTGYRWVPVGEVASLRVPAELPGLIASAARYAAERACKPGRTARDPRRQRLPDGEMPLLNLAGSGRAGLLDEPGRRVRWLAVQVSRAEGRTCHREVTAGAMAGGSPASRPRPPDAPAPIPGSAR